MALNKYAVIVAGGKGIRMGAELPKQFLEVEGIPVLMRTLMAFHNTDADIQIILVLPEVQMDFWKHLCVKHKFEIPHTIANGGSERFYSVKNGIACIKNEGECLVAIHDGVRPFVSPDIIKNAYAEAERHGNAIPCIAVPDSVRIVGNDGTNYSADRSAMRLIQTPQTFRYSIIKSAYDISFTEKITDDASVIELNGHQIHLIEGQRLNIKITAPEDLLLAKSIANQ